MSKTLLVVAALSAVFCISPAFAGPGEGGASCYSIHKYSTSHPNGTVPANGTITYLVDVENLCAFPIQEAIFKEYYPEGAVLRDFSSGGGGWTCQTGGTHAVFCGGPLAAGERHTFLVKVKLDFPAYRWIFNRACISDANYGEACHGIYHWTTRFDLL